MDYRAQVNTESNDVTPQVVIELDMLSLACVAGGVGEIAVG